MNEIERVGEGFDYSVLASDVATELRAIAENIWGIYRRAVIDIGKLLSQAKTRLGHGRFTSWASSELGVDERSAERYMKASHFCSAKPDTVSALPVSLLYRLSAPSAPPHIVRAVVDAAERGEPLTPPEIKKLLDDAKVPTDQTVVGALRAAETFSYKIVEKPTEPLKAVAYTIVSKPVKPTLKKRRLRLEAVDEEPLGEEPVSDPTPTSAADEPASIVVVRILRSELGLNDTDASEVLNHYAAIIAKLGSIDHAIRVLNILATAEDDDPIAEAVRELASPASRTLN